MGAVSSHLATKRFFISLIGGITAGLISSAFLLKLNFIDLNGDAYWGSAIMVSILFNRFLIGLFVFLAGIFFDAACPICGVRFFPVMRVRHIVLARTEFRGIAIGIITSLELAFSSSLGGASVGAFLTILVMGGFYGMVINWIVTRAKFRRYVIEEQEKEFRKEHEQRAKERESYILGSGKQIHKKFEKKEESSKEDEFSEKEAKND